MPGQKLFAFHTAILSRVRLPVPAGSGVGAGTGSSCVLSRCLHVAAVADPARVVADGADRSVHQRYRHPSPISGLSCGD